MNTVLTRSVTVVLTLACLAWNAFAAPEAATQPADWQTEFRFGGCGGAYFLAEPGELWVEVEKQDLNRTSRNTHLRAILVSPDRSVIDEQWLSDTGGKKGDGPGPVQRLRFKTSVPRKGIYGLNITVTEDRYGEEIAWGFRTNCPHYLVETSRGHRDARHEEPLVLRNLDTPGDVCFAPQQGGFAMEITGLPKGSGPITVYDGQDKEVGTLDVDEKGQAQGEFETGVLLTAAPWRVHFPKFQGVVKIDGLTRWSTSGFTQWDKKNGGRANLSLWTPQPASWFNFVENRWLLTPYSRTVYAEPGTKGSVDFRVHNNAASTKTIGLGLELPDGSWSDQLPIQEVTLKPDQAAMVSVQYQVPSGGETWVCRLHATPKDASGVTTYSTLRVHQGTAPAENPLPIPLVLKPYQHENERFGYMPTYPLTNQVYFDTKNQPVITAQRAVSVWRDGAWHEHARYLRSSKAAFDRDNDLYLMGTSAKAPALLHSRDQGKTFEAYRIPGNGGFDIEQFSGHNTPAGPPPFARYTVTAKDPKLMWRRLNDLSLFLPEKKEDGTLSLGEPVLVSKKCIGFSAHSGIPSSLVSRGSKVHVAWAEATDPKEEVPGVPTFVATYDRETRTLGEAALVGYGPPANDVHNTPCITMDSKGFLHVLVGTHGRAFRYARSLKPNDASGGWTQSEEIGPGLRQTYVGLVCDQDDTLHLVFRLWRKGAEYFPASLYASLAYMRKPAGQPWSEPRPLIIAPFSEYSVYYHRLTIDRAGQLFLSYDYWSTFWFYRMDHVGSRRALMMSPDQGQSWKLADLADLTR